jgi:hypothetical protein
MNDESKMPIGKNHKGKPLKDVPDQYLQYMFDAGYLDKRPELKEYVENRIPVLRFLKEKREQEQSKKK